MITQELFSANKSLSLHFLTLLNYLRYTQFPRWSDPKYVEMTESLVFKSVAPTRTTARFVAMWDQP